MKPNTKAAKSAKENFHRHAAKIGDVYCGAGYRHWAEPDWNVQAASSRTPSAKDGAG